MLVELIRSADCATAPTPSKLWGFGTWCPLVAHIRVAARKAAENRPKSASISVAHGPMGVQIVDDEFVPMNLTGLPP